MDSRATQLAEIFLNHSLKVKPKDNLLIAASDFTAKDLLQEIYRIALKKGANVYLDIAGVNYYRTRADVDSYFNIFANNSTKAQQEAIKPIIDAKIDWATKILSLVTIHNQGFLGETPTAKVNTIREAYQSSFTKYLTKDWLLTYYPTAGTAQNAGMSEDQFVDYYYKACLVDYKQMNKDIKKLETIMDKGSVVHIKSVDTDLKIGIKGRLAQGQHGGTRNVPDGECFIGPLENFTNGYITFPLPQVWGGYEVNNIRLEFSKGKISNYSADTGLDFLKSVLEQHPGNKSLGELGIGMNKMITKYIKNILFDEKIAGSIHMALGNSYSEVRGGGKNKGTIHWDLVKDLRQKGSSVSIDDKIIIKDGKVLV